MGQRLVITVEFGGERILNCYMHWSAYTGSTLACASSFSKRWMAKYANKEFSKADVLSCAFEAWPGSGLIENEIPHLAEFGFKGVEARKATNRNDGLIAITEKEMDDSQRWSEGDLRICIDDDGNLEFWTDVYGIDRGDPEYDEENPPEQSESDLLDSAVTALYEGYEIGPDALSALLIASDAVWGKSFAVRTKSGLVFRLIA